MGLDRDVEHYSQASPACPSLPVSWNACLKDTVYLGPQPRPGSRSLGRALKSIFCKFLRWFIWPTCLRIPEKGREGYTHPCHSNQQHHLETSARNVESRAPPRPIGLRICTLSSCPSGLCVHFKVWNSSVQTLSSSFTWIAGEKNCQSWLMTYYD